MRELLEQAAELIDDFTDCTDLQSMPMVPHEAYRVAIDLRELAKTAALRDELWAAATRHGKACHKIYSGDISLAGTIGRVCMRVAEAET